MAILDQNRFAAFAAAALLVIASSACTAQAGESQPAAQPSTSAVAAEAADERTPEQIEAETVVAEFEEASNTHDAEAIAALIAEDAQWYTVGRIFSGREEIMADFLQPELIEVEGRLDVAQSYWDGYRVQVDYMWTSATESNIGLHYAYLVEDGVITDVVEYLNCVDCE
ncbi:nuclear transport factor 2 family protein [Allonocardiopsis opalescens]|uniref:Uncharacterized protein (TIGR02246 family) n=1 Tax=Allonocardiopsis opalescens TaxID=1144618 RepID=A0A2T0PZM8_9ACTN|nr:nuclear transport factor 2 family protein [Allonocardiopsis opalescens]PRX97000.1 uncharacterized protein (TIGR02246 family) [Allonocardiopsis opalescens]